MIKKIPKGLKEFNKKLENDTFFYKFCAILYITLMCIALSIYFIFQEGIDGKINYYKDIIEYKKNDNEFIKENKKLYDERKVYLRKSDKRDSLDLTIYNAENDVEIDDYIEFYYKGVWVKNIFNLEDMHKYNFYVNDVVFEERKEDIEKMSFTNGHYVKPHDLIREIINYYINEFNYKEKDFINLKIYLCYCYTEKSKGLYFASSNSIVITMYEYTPKKFMSTLSHEMAHFVDNRKLKTKDRYAYFKEFKEKELGEFDKNFYKKTNLNEFDKDKEWVEKYGEILAEDIKFVVDSEYMTEKNAITKDIIKEKEKNFLIHIVKKTRRNNIFNKSS